MRRLLWLCVLVLPIFACGLKLVLVSVMDACPEVLLFNQLADLLIDSLLLALRF